MGVQGPPFFMEKDKLKGIVSRLKLLVDQLESEVYSDPDAYIDKRENVDAPLTDYIEIFEDDDGYPD